MGFWPHAMPLDGFLGRLMFALASAAMLFGMFLHRFAAAWRPARKFLPVAASQAHEGRNLDRAKNPGTNHLGVSKCP